MRISSESIPIESFRNKTERRYLGRLEHFGLLIYDRNLLEYFILNELSYRILDSIDNLDKFFEKYESMLEEDEIPGLHNLVEGFIEWCNVQNLTDNGRANISILPERDIIPQNHMIAPMRVFLDITNRCNLRCKHCGALVKASAENELTLSDFGRLFREMREIGAWEVSIAGGEPLIREDFFEILDLAYENYLTVFISTNGLMLNRENLRRLKSYKSLQLKVSFEGTNKVEYEEVRGKGTYGKFKKNLDLLKELGFPFMLRLTLMKGNIDKLEDFIRFAIDQGIEKISIGLIKKTPRTKDLFPSSEQFFRFVRDINSDRFIKYDEQIEIFTAASFVPIEEKGLRFYDNFGCSAANTSLHINSEGRVDPCNFLHSPNPVNIRNTTIDEVWNGDSYFKRIRNIKIPKKCADCRYYYQCRGGCRAYDLEEPDFYCIRDIF